VAGTRHFGDLVSVDVDEHERPLGVEVLLPPSLVTYEVLKSAIERFPELKTLAGPSLLLSA
jgi:hypothetical protein